MSMTLLPPKEGTCAACAVEHRDDQPHNQQSLYYQYRFYGLRGRWPTWADAIAHCDRETQSMWRRALVAKGAWSEPEGEPIADPPAELIRQTTPIGGPPQVVEVDQAQLLANHLSNSPAIDVELCPGSAAALIATIKLALRHPEFTGPTADLMRSLKDDLIERLARGDVAVEQLLRYEEETPSDEC